MKYELTSETKRLFGVPLFRVRAVTSFGRVNAGDVGGWIEKESNLSQEGTSWVYGDARVYGDAWVCGNALVCGDAQVYGNALVCGDAQVYGNAWVCGNALVCGDAQVYGNALVCGDAQVYGNAHITKVNLTAVRSDNYTFSVVSTPEGVRVIAGCRYFSFEEARKHWTKTRANTPLGEETFAILDLLEAQARIHKL